jgi:arylsulfatase
MSFKKISVVVLIGFLFWAGCSKNRSGKPARPNLVFILADDLGYGELGSYGQELIETPHIDLLAQEGIRFTQHYSGSPVCAPSRCVLLTGLHSGHAYIRGNDEWSERGDVWNFSAAFEDPNLEGQRPLPPGTETVGRLLQNAGYKTAIVGKWGLGGPLTEGIPNLQGFDFFFGYNCQRQAHTYFPLHLWRNREKLLLDNDFVPPGTQLEDGEDPNDPDSYSRYWLNQYSPNLMLKEALDFLETNQNNSFFLYYASPIPHVPLQAPRRWVEYYQNKLGKEEPYLGDQGYFPNNTPRATYAAMVSFLDEQVGVLVEKLKELGVYKNTVIFFSSDNGPTYAGGADSAFFRSAGPFKTDSGWIKGSVREGGIRVPLIVSWPGRIATNSTTAHLSSFYDLLPTLCELSGANLPDKTDGISFVPALLGSGNQAKHRFLYWEFPSYGGQQAVRMGDWKGVRQGLLEDETDKAVKLYDLQRDPLEQYDISDSHPEIVDQIQEIMFQEHIVPEIVRFRMEALGDPIPARKQ